jgi:hypothetical protein
MRKKRILVVLPSPLMARNFLRSDTLAALTGRLGAQVTVVSPSEADRQTAERHGASWVPYFHPRRWREPAGDDALAGLRRGAWYARYLIGLFLHMVLTYRFNSIAGFAGFQARLRQSWRVRKIYLREGLPMSRLFGFPFAASKLLYRTLYALYYRRWQSFAPVNRLLADQRPDLMVLSMTQTHMVTPYAQAAADAGVAVLGINGSWDQPTTKGPVCPGIARFVVQNDIVREELVRYHGIPAERIAVIGWLQMDPYVKPDTTARADLLARLGVPAGHRYILFAANAPRLGPHEPDMFRQLAARAAAGAFGEDVTLVCRCHPQDRNWQARWGWAAGLPRTVVEAPDLGPLEHLTTLIRNAEAVIASAGSINLDAVALDTPSIGLAWEDENLPYWDRHARAYALEHLAELRSGSGIMFARNLDELLTACTRYLDDRTADAAGREQIRQRYLYRLDGGAATRLVDEIEAML